jgi:hypothetical protein
MDPSKHATKPSPELDRIVVVFEAITDESLVAW